jgi:hypothetical protein
MAAAMQFLRRLSENILATLTNLPRIDPKGQKADEASNLTV